MVATGSTIMMLLILEYLAESATCCKEPLIRLPPINFSTCTNTTTLISQQQQMVEPLLAQTCGEACSSKRRVVFLNMSKSSFQCPGAWSLVESPVRGCLSGLAVPGCASVFFATSGPYNQVCGRVLGYQKGTTDAFFNALNNEDIDGPYIDGVSLTNGAPTNRTHIWSFASALNTHSSETSSSCPCSNTMTDWPYQVPSFIGNNYFCDSGLAALASWDDPLWDGKGCGATSTCCEFNNPPWFYAKLPATTSDDLELRICRDEPQVNENVLVSFIELYVSTEEQ